MSFIFFSLFQWLLDFPLNCFSCFSSGSKSTFLLSLFICFTHWTPNLFNLCLFALPDTPTTSHEMGCNSKSTGEPGLFTQQFIDWRIISKACIKRSHQKVKKIKNAAIEIFVFYRIKYRYYSITCLSSVNSKGVFVAVLCKKLYTNKIGLICMTVIVILAKVIHSCCNSLLLLICIFLTALAGVWKWCATE